MRSNPRRSRKGTTRKTTDHMKLIESSPKRVVAYFGDTKVNDVANYK